jgi:hypothetical protein
VELVSGVHEAAELTGQIRPDVPMHEVLSHASDFAQLALLKNGVWERANTQ